MSRKKSMKIDLHSNDAEQINLAKKLLKKQLLYPATKFRHHINERAHVLELLKRTVEHGESNSLLLIGPRGSGKTTLINSVLQELNSLKTFREDALVVHLHGLVHTDDRLALKDATRQMQLENVVGDRVFGSFAENLSFLLDCLKSGDKKQSKPVIFILDDFELFCSHNNQTLLYNLFDVSQSAQSPVCVIGISSRIDVIELLEKRVKSRFSHRQIFILPKDLSGSEVKNKTEDWIELFKELLTLSYDENVNKGKEDNFKKKWNTHIESLALKPEIHDIIRNFQKFDVTERNFRYFLAVAITSLSESHTRLEISDFCKAVNLFRKDHKVVMLEGLSILELCLVIAMMHETEIFGDEPINFEAVFNRYSHFINQKSSIESVPRPVVMKAFEHLKNLEIITPIGGSNQKIEKEYQHYKFELTKSQVDEAIRNYINLPTDVTHWAQSNGII